MKKITVPVDGDDVLNNFTIEEIIKFFTVKDILEHITDKQYLENGDVYALIEEIDEDYTDKLQEFLKDKYDD